MPTDTTPPSPSVCAHTGKLGCVGLRLHKAHRKKVYAFLLLLGWAFCPGHSQGLRQVDAGICHAVENAHLREKTSTEQTVTCKYFQVILFCTWLVTPCGLNVDVLFRCFS